MSTATFYTQDSNLFQWGGLGGRGGVWLETCIIFKRDDGHHPGAAVAVV